MSERQQPVANLQSTTRLADGVEMPWLGLGTYEASGEEAAVAVRTAIEIGYRSIDTAAFYDNEEEVGRGIRESGVPREDIFVTTKLWNDDQGYENALVAFNASMERLNMDYVDLYLVHWPIPDKIVDTWRALETIHTDGRARSIGVSNFLETHLDDLLASATVSPTVNQIEFHPHLQPGDLITYCVDREIQVVAWSPLVRGEALAINEINQIGERYQKTAAQVVLRWQLQRGIVTIPKSVKREHIQANADIFDFELSASEMVTMNGLNRNRRTGPDPTHPPS